MAKISTLFWDVGGVLLSNGWDHELRRRAANQFGLDWQDFQTRHEMVDHDFETGRISLESYLASTIFYREQPFAPEAFKAFMFENSTALAGGLEILAQLASKGGYLMAALNNESLELNEHRIERFGLRDYFSFFLSSCFVGFCKPELEIYRLALKVSQRDPAACVFIDDRAANVECARQLGICGIQYQSPEQLSEDLRALGVCLDS